MKQLFTSLAFAAFMSLLFISVTFAQKAKFGNVGTEELQMKVYDKDTSAVAVVLSDFGSSRFIFSSQVQLVSERHTRIKILKKAGYTWADIEVPFYKKGNDREKVTSIKGFTYNLENGKVKKDKLEARASFEEQRSENWFIEKFTMPNVKEGSIIEFTYTVTSDFVYNLRDWEFQSSIPTVWSEYQVFIPEYYDYKFLQQGYQKIYTPSELGISHNLVNDGYKWIAKDVPALREEKFITTLQDYVSRIEFELERVKYPGQDVKTMTLTWDELERDLLEEQYFGRQINRSGYFKDHLAAIIVQHKEPAEQMDAIYKLVQNRITWNGKYGILAGSVVKKAFEDGKGSAAETNLLLTAMLQEAGLDASPVLVSTRAHGKPYKGTPLRNKFNYIVSHVKIDGKEYLLDATDPMLPAGMLPERSLNGEGYLIKAKESRWVALKPSGSFVKSIVLNVEISEDGSILGKGSESVGGYSALRVREAVKSEGQAKYLKDLSRESGDFKMSNHSIANLDVLDKALNITYDISSKANESGNSILYLNPVLGFGEKENPFKISERFYPVDFGAAHDETIVSTYTIPAGWILDEKPESVKINLPDNGGSFTYLVQQTGSQLQVMSRVTLARPIYNPGEYATLKKFFDEIVAKQAEQVVLKKQI